MQKTVRWYLESGRDHEDFILSANIFDCIVSVVLQYL